jgi:hypothetical protein
VAEAKRVFKGKPALRNIRCAGARAGQRAHLIRNQQVTDPVLYPV